MKIKQLLPALLLSGIATGAMAQGFSIGPKVGANFSTFGVTAYNISTPIGEVAVDEMQNDKEMLIGPQGGLMFNFRFDDNFSFQPELLYSAKGFKQGGTYRGLRPNDIHAGQERDYTIKLNYIEMPLLFRVAVGSPTVKANLMAGPYAAYLLNGSDNLSLGGTEIHSGDLNYNFNETRPNYFFKRWDYGASVGAGLSILAGAGTFQLDARYSMSIPEVISYHPREGDIAVRNRNNTISVSLGWLYHFPYSPRPARDYGGVFDSDR